MITGPGFYTTRAGFMIRIYAICDDMKLLRDKPAVGLYEPSREGDYMIWNDWALDGRYSDDQGDTVLDIVARCPDQIEAYYLWNAKLCNLRMSIREEEPA